MFLKFYLSLVVFLTAIFPTFCYIVRILIKIKYLKTIYPFKGKQHEKNNSCDTYFNVHSKLCQG